MKHILIDTNVILRHLLQDSEKHSKSAEKIFAAADAREVVLVLIPEVLAEAVFVLESFYKHTRTNIVRSLSQLISYPGVELHEYAIHLRALDLYASSKLHYIDCVLAATAAARSLPVASFDADLKKIADVKVEL